MGPFSGPNLNMPIYVILKKTLATGIFEGVKCPSRMLSSRQPKGKGY